MNTSSTHTYTHLCVCVCVSVFAVKRLVKCRLTPWKVLTVCVKCSFSHCDVHWKLFAAAPSPSWRSRCRLTVNNCTLICSACNAASEAVSRFTFCFFYFFFSLLPPMETKQNLHNNWRKVFVFYDSILFFFFWFLLFLFRFFGIILVILFLLFSAGLQSNYSWRRSAARRTHKMGRRKSLLSSRRIKRAHV